MAGYIDKSLVEGEHVIARAYYHWVEWIWPVLAIVIPVALLIAEWTYVTPQHREWLDYITYSLLGAGVLYFLWELIRIRETELAVTDRRFIRKTGWISRDTNEIELRSIEEVNLKQTILGRLLGYGTIIIRGTGAGVVPSPGIARPREFQKAIQSGQAKMRAAMGPAPIQIHTGAQTQG